MICQRVIGLFVGDDYVQLLSFNGTEKLDPGGISVCVYDFDPLFENRLAFYQSQKFMDVFELNDESDAFGLLTAARDQS